MQVCLGVLCCKGVPSCAVPHMLTALAVGQVEVEVEVEVIQYVNQIVEKEVTEYVDVPVGRVVYNDVIETEEVALQLFICVPSLRVGMPRCMRLCHISLPLQQCIRDGDEATLALSR